jgi:hypothetical protein
LTSGKNSVFSNFTFGYLQTCTSGRFDSVAVQQAERFASLDDKSQKIIGALLDLQNSLPNDILDQRKAVAQMLDRLDSHPSSSPSGPPPASGISSSSELSPLLKNSQISRTETSTSAQASEDELKLKQEVETSILETLRVTITTDLLEEVSEAHQSTFKEIFEPHEGDCFRSWLKTGNGIYCMNGKAGSGKSTLMRYIYGHPTTRQELSQWASPTSLSIAGFFFYNSGTKEQRSQLGLLQALLFKVLSESRDLIPVVLPWLYARRYTEAFDPLIPHFSEKPLSLSHLTQAFTVLAQQTTVPLKLCLFIDGLDEYEGDFDKIVEVLKVVSRSQSVKICASSKRSLVFEDAFPGSPSLKLQDLTLNAIQNYVHEELATNKRYQQLAADEAVAAAALEQEIVASADGVFLWARLVVESLLSGFEDGDIHHLQERLRILPTDLEKLYHYILMNRIDPVYMDDASKMFRIMQVASHSELSILAFALTDESYHERAISSSIRPWKEEEVLSACQKMEDRLKTRCAGLIEVSGKVTEGQYGSSSNEANGKVQYLHRTLRDFLEKPEIHHLIASHVKRLQFDAYFSLLQSSLIRLKSISKHQEPWTLAREAMQYSLHAELKNDAHMALVHELGRTIKAYRRTSPNFYPEKWSESFLAVAVQYNLWPYVETQLGSQELLKQGVTVRTLLAYALGARGFFNYDIEHNKEMVGILLKQATKNGTNSTIFKTSSIWQQVLQALEERYLSEEFFLRQFHVVLLFLQYGADPQATCHLKDGRELSAETIIREGLVKYPHPATEDILRLLDVQEVLVKPKNSVIQRLSTWSTGKSKSKNKTSII